MTKLDTILVYHWHAWRGYLISHMVADYCQIEAHYEDDVSVIESKLTPNISAVLFQINLSQSALFPARRPEIVQMLQKRNIQVFNSEIADINKSHLHYLLEKAGLASAKANPLGPPGEWLFVKSNLNWGGEPEQRLDKNTRQHLFSNQTSHLRGWDNYYRVKRADINPALWGDSSIVIERFVENHEQSFYRIYCFGDGIVVVKAHSTALIKKIGDHAKDQNFYYTKTQIMHEKCDMPTALQHNIKTFISHYPLTYCCLDMVHDMNNFYIIDLNLTPYSGVQEQNNEATRFLVKGAHRQMKTYHQQQQVLKQPKPQGISII